MLERLKRFFLMKDVDGGSRDVDGDETGAAYLPREKLLVFGVSLLLALCLWFIVNLNRDFTISIDLPIEIRNLSNEMALVSDPPENARVSVTGEGWMLIGLYTNPPRLTLDVESAEVNLTERIQRQISMISDVTVTEVDPSRIDLEMEQRVEREVPVGTDLDVRFRGRFGAVGQPAIEPQTVVISGAASRIEGIDTVYTRYRLIEDVEQDLKLQLELEPPARGIRLGSSDIWYELEVTEFTEAEMSIPIRVRNLPPGQSITYNPTRLVVRYYVPINQYNDALNTRPYSVWLDYQEIREDTTGQVVPEVERNEDEFDIRLRTYQPRRISYFTVVQNEENQ